MAKKIRGLTFYQKEKKINKRVVIGVLEVFLSTLIAVFLAFFTMYFWGRQTVVIGDSMQPALFNGQTVLIDQFIYKISSPKRGDVVVFLPNGNENTHFYEKRIVGLPGEKVQIKDGHVYIDGIRLNEENEYDLIADPGIAGSELELEINEYFVLGDNRNSSEDSRSGNLGPVKKDYIIGKAWFHMAYGSQGMGAVN